MDETITTIRANSVEEREIFERFLEKDRQAKEFVGKNSTYIQLSLDYADNDARKKRQLNTITVLGDITSLDHVQSESALTKQVFYFMNQKPGNVVEQFVGLVGKLGLGSCTTQTSQNGLYRFICDAQFYSAFQNAIKCMPNAIGLEL